MKTRKTLLGVVLGLCSFVCLTFGVLLCPNTQTLLSANAEETTRVEAAAGEITFEEGASIRTDPENMGIRFRAFYSKDLYELSATGDVGMIIVPSPALEGVGNADYFTYLKNEHGKAKTSVSTQFKPAQFTDNGDDTYYAWGAIVNLKDNNLAYDYTAIAYYYDSAKSCYVYSEPSVERSISYVADAALKDAEVTGEARTKLFTAVSSLSEQLNTAGKTDGSKITFETELSEGLDLSAYAVGDRTSITSVAIGDKTYTPVENKLTFVDTSTLSGYDTTAAFGDAQLMTLTFADETTLKLNASVWSLFISNESELQTAYQYTVVGNSRVKGYFKLNADIEMTNDGTANWYGSGRPIGYKPDDSGLGTGPYYDSGFEGIFDGDGYKISNFVVKNDDKGLFYSLGNHSVVRNLAIEAINLTKGSKQNYPGYGSGVLSRFLQGGTFENITATLTLKESSYCEPVGGLFGQGGQYGQVGKISMTDITVIASSASENVSYNPALFSYKGDNVTETATSFTLKNVAVVGFNNIVSSYTLTGSTTTYYGSTINEAAVTTYTTADALAHAAYTTCENIVKYATAEEYLYKDAIALDPVETDLDVKEDTDGNKTISREYDMKALVENKTIATIAVSGGASVTHENGVVTFTTDDASDVAKVYYITTEDGTVYKATITVWTLLVSSEEEWVTINSEYLGITGENNPNSLKGYFKLDADISLTVNSTNRNQYSLGKIDKIANDFAIVLDGGNHTLTWT
ncbi:MAG: hypothetical protein IJX75_01725, partial [Clostridia bacterium]|nr:hypothetical protein [Clostridia bacterium]